MPGELDPRRCGAHRYREQLVKIRDALVIDAINLLHSERFDGFCLILPTGISRVWAG